MVTITVETGVGVLNANSFVTVAEARSYALDRGVVLSAVDDTVAAQLIKAKDYLEALADQYQGYMVSAEQALQWPRSGVYLYDSEAEFSAAAIPKELKSAQCALVMALDSGVDITPVYTPSQLVIEETVGPITTKYADPRGAKPTPVMTAVNAMIAPLLERKKASLRTVRV